jgi:Na+-driven multidrug efflux pump
MNAPALLLQAGSPGGGDSPLPIVFIIVALLVGLVLCVVYVVSLVWIYRDAERRGKSGILVALLVALISWPIGLIVWLLVRDKL